MKLIDAEGEAVGEWTWDQVQDELQILELPSGARAELTALMPKPDTPS